jgi:DNA-binding beta-propeller fold protein YncE
MRFRLVGFVATAAMMGGCGGASPAPEQASTNPTAATPAVANSASCARRHPGDGARRLGRTQEGSAVALARAGDSTLAYVADEDADVLYTMDITDGRTRATTSLGGAPSQVVMFEDGRVVVSVRDKNRVDVYEPAASPDAPLERLCSIATPVEPVGLALSPDESNLVVTSAWARKLTAYDTKTMKPRLHKTLPREPRGVVVDEDGKRAFVAHVVGGMLSVVDLEADSDRREVDLRVPKTSGSTTGGKLRASCQGFALAKSVVMKDPMQPAPTPAEANSLPIELSPPPPVVPQGRIFAPRVTIDPGEPSRRSSGYGNSSFSRIESPIVSVVDSAAERNLTTALLQPRNRRGAATGECLLPRAAAMSGDGLLVACMGSDALVELDSRGADPSRLERRRWKVAGGPTGVAVDAKDGRAVVWSQFERKLSVVDLRSKSTTTAVEHLSAPKAKTRLTKEQAKGRELFHQTDDMRISRDGRACASCHPDGREDALTWSTPVGPRQTIMLAGRLDGTGPFSWLGVHESIEVHLNTTFQRLGGSGLQHGDHKQDMKALIAYLKVMPGPNLGGEVASHEAELMAEGERLFYAEDTKCADCHVGGKTDAKRYDLGTRASGDRDEQFDTPSLQYVSGTAPYFHDGRYATLLEVLMSTDSQMGHSMHLSRQQAVALEAFLGTL